MKKFYLFLGLLVAILIGLMANEPDKYQTFTKLNTNKLFFDDDLSVKSTLHSPFTKEDFFNKISLVFFGYTRCPDFCPDTLTKLNKIYKSLEDKNYINIDKLQIIFVSVDTKNDDIVTVKKYVQYFNNHFIGLSMDPVDLTNLSQSIGLYYEKISSNQNIDLYEHTSAIFLVDQTGKLFGIFTPPFNLSVLEKDISKLLN